nr:MAG TPA: hypothetical protein [Caudoviricetes sp.]
MPASRKWKISIKKTYLDNLHITFSFFTVNKTVKISKKYALNRLKTQVIKNRFSTAKSGETLDITRNPAATTATGFLFLWQREKDSNPHNKS